MEDLPRWYCAADLFAMPNRTVNNDTEGFGMVYLEAAACGRPAIAGLVGGTGSAVLDEITGLRVNGESLDAVVKALRRLLNDTTLAKRLGEQGQHRVMENFSWEQVAHQTDLLHQDIKKNKSILSTSHSTKSGTSGL